MSKISINSNSYGYGSIGGEPSRPEPDRSDETALIDRAQVKKITGLTDADIDVGAHGFPPRMDRAPWRAFVPTKQLWKKSAVLLWHREIKAFAARLR